MWMYLPPSTDYREKNEEVKVRRWQCYLGEDSETVEMISSPVCYP